MTHGLWSTSCSTQDHPPTQLPTHPLARAQSLRVGREHESVAQRVVRGGRGAGCERGLGGRELGEQLLCRFGVVRAQRAAPRRE